MREGVTLEAVAGLDEQQIESIAGAVPGGRSHIEAIQPLAPLQETLLFQRLLRRRSDADAVSAVINLASRAQVNALGSALQAMIDRHAILRTAIHWEGLPRAVQVIHRRATLPIEEVQLEPNRNPLEQLRERAAGARLGTDLQQAPLIRVHVAADPHGAGWYAVLQLDRIVCDDHSLDDLISEAMRAVLDRAPEHSAASFEQYAVSSVVPASTSEEFFRTELAEVCEPTAPFGIVDALNGHEPAREHAERLDGELGQHIQDQAGALDVDVAALIHAAWSLVVSRTSGRDDVVYGTVVSHARKATLPRRVLGLAANILPLRMKLAGLTAKELVQRTHSALVELSKHEFASLTIAKRCSGIDPSSPLFTALLHYKQSSTRYPERMGDDGVRVLDKKSRWSGHAIALCVEAIGSEIALTAQTDPRIDPLRVTRYVRTAMRSLVDALHAAPDTPASALSILPEAERCEILESFNATKIAYPKHKLIHQLFEDQAVRTPDRVAALHGFQQLTYAELNAKANRLASHLRARDVGPDGLVAIYLERGLDMVIALLGTLKAGAAYLPLDPNYPHERLQYMLGDARPRVVLTESRLKPTLPPSQAEVIALDAPLRQGSGNGMKRPAIERREPDAGDLVYVIYTSGSTGRPKGTAMPHRAMVNLIEWHRRTFGAGTGRRVLQFAALSFDVAFQEIFSTLCTGDTLVLLDEWVRRDANALTEFLARHAIERLFVPPLMLQSIAECCRQAGSIPERLTDVVTAGEQLRIGPEIADMFTGLQGCRLHNHYGPTETHVVTSLTLESDPRQWPALPTIGRPISNAQIYVLDERRRPVPLGVIGEIYIGGANVARGYLDRPELTAERFFRDPFSADHHARMYKTGDQGRWRSDGTVEYLGRNDDQVKIRGYRIELGEIEARLAQYPKVKGTAVIAREDTPGEKRLVAYVTAREAGDIDVEELRSRLRAELPDYMVPSAFVVLEDLPLTPTGKLNRRALPAPDPAAFARLSYLAPKGEIEEMLAQLWQELLRVERVGRSDNFFDLGGHSLLGTRLITRVRELFQVTLPLSAIFEAPTVEQLSVRLRSELDAQAARESLQASSLVHELRQEISELADDAVLARIAALERDLGLAKRGRAS